MKFSSLVLALALALTSADRNFKPEVSASFGHKKIGGGLSKDGMEAEMRMETEVSDELRVGLEYDHSAAANGNPIRSVFAKVSQKMGGGDVDADLQMDMNDNTMSGEVAYRSGDNTITTHVSSGSANFVERVELARSQAANGLNYMFRPTFNVKDNNLDIEASADLDVNTNMMVKLSQADSSADVELNHRLDADTDVKVSMQGMDWQQPTVEVSRRLDDDNTVKPRFDMSSKHLTCAWVRKLNNARTATVNVDPENSIDFELESADEKDWNAKVTAPWGNFGDADVRVGRKFQF